MNNLKRSDARQPLGDFNAASRQSITRCFTLTLISVPESFVHEGPVGTAPRSNMAFQVSYLWANRVSERAAQSIVAGDETYKAELYNATQLPYRRGLEKRDPRLLVKQLGILSPESPVLDAKVRRHSVKLFRLSALSNEDGAYLTAKDEL